MKILKKGMRLWIALASMFSFLASWALFAHSEKPEPLQVSLPALSNPAPEPLVPVTRFNGATRVSPQVRTFRPRLRTGGS